MKVILSIAIEWAIGQKQISVIALKIELNHFVLFCFLLLNYIINTFA